MRVLNLACNASGSERNWSVFEHIHTKKRNRLEQKHLNDLVYIKYNQALKECFDLKDQLDPISLDIDESNEWLVGTLDEENNEAEVDNELVFDDDDLTWGDVTRANGVTESITYTRSKGKSAASTSTFRVQKQTPIIQVFGDEDEDDDEEELDIEEDNGQGGGIDETLDLDGDDVEFDV
ncbi:uncharacterized protein LOC120091866 [Benincasa hispida]|uniref:uncharacterized protein LOC120091866 n=1 Tax=Benincasa hispida TaxID=102211 RepID=UPI0018FFC26C|nr:uncharacterized protein LOC120091866 [Benincasa hispida]